MVSAAFNGLFPEKRGCPHSRHYPTRSPVVINDKRLEYWFVNLQSGAIRCKMPNYMSLTNAKRGGRCAHAQLRIVCKLGFLKPRFRLFSARPYWLTSLCVCVVTGSEPAAPAWYAPNPHTHSVSQDIRLDWWFVMAAGSLSISFLSPPHPNPAPPPTAAHPFAPVPHCGVIRTATLERGDDSRLHTQSLEKILHFPPDFGLERVSTQSWKNEVQKCVILADRWFRPWQKRHIN